MTRLHEGALPAFECNSGALVMFDVATSSIGVTLEDDHAKKTLRLSPVMLAYWSDFFAARYRPGAEWIRSSVRVENIQIAEEVLRACYAGLGPQMNTWNEKDPEWFFGVLMQCDMWQIHHQMVDIVVEKLRSRLIDPDLIVKHLPAMHTLLRTTIGSQNCFKELFSELFEIIAGSDGKTLQVKIDAMPDGLRLDFLWHIINTGTPSVARRGLKNLIYDLMHMEEGPIARSYLHRILSEDPINLGIGVSSGKVMQWLARIDGYVLDGSLVGSCREALAVSLIGGYPENTKRRRDKETDECDVDYELSD